MASPAGSTASRTHTPPPASRYACVCVCKQITAPFLIVVSAFAVVDSIGGGSTAPVSMVQGCAEPDTASRARAVAHTLPCSPAHCPLLQVAPDHFLTNVAAVRSAHVLVMQHGAGAINSFFMRQQDAGPSALVELRPCK